MSAFWQDTGAGLSGGLYGAAGGATAGAAFGSKFGPWGAAIGAGLGLITSVKGSSKRRRMTRDAEKKAKSAIMDRRRRRLMEKYQARKQEQNMASGSQRIRAASRGSVNQEGNILAQDALIHSSGSF